jgi:hypothetical protein
LFRTHGIPFYLKIDIEGADHLVLEELQEFNDRPRYVSMEAEKIDFARLTAELETLKDLGYIAFKPVQQESIPGTAIETTTLRGERLHHSFEQASSGPFGDDLSGSWLTYDECLRRFRAIFWLYRLFADDGLLPRMPGGMKVMGALARVYRRPLPGWYDIHAKLG